MKILNSPFKAFLFCFALFIVIISISNRGLKSIHSQFEVYRPSIEGITPAPGLTVAGAKFCTISNSKHYFSFDETLVTISFFEFQDIIFKGTYKIVENSILISLNKADNPNLTIDFSPSVLVTEVSPVGDIQGITIGQEFHVNWCGN